MYHRIYISQDGPRDTKSLPGCLYGTLHELILGRKLNGRTYETVVEQTVIVTTSRELQLTLGEIQEGGRVNLVHLIKEYLPDGGSVLMTFHECLHMKDVLVLYDTKSNKIMLSSAN